MAPENGIEVRGLVREYKKGPRAVDGIDLAVEPGEIYGFLGPNGAGKSTTVHVLTTLLPPTAGTALVAGYEVVKDGAKIRGLIGVALQEAALDPLMTGRELMELQATLHGIAPRQVVHCFSSMSFRSWARPSDKARLIVPTGRCNALATSATGRSA